MLCENCLFGKLNLLKPLMLNYVEDKIGSLEFKRSTLLVMNADCKECIAKKNFLDARIFKDGMEAMREIIMEILKEVNFCEKHLDKIDAKVSEYLDSTKVFVHKKKVGAKKMRVKNSAPLNPDQINPNWNFQMDKTRGEIGDVIVHDETDNTYMLGFSQFSRGFWYHLNDLETVEEAAND